MSVEDVPDDVMADDDDEGDNDVFDDVTPDERGGLTPAPPAIDEDHEDQDYIAKPGSDIGGHTPPNLETVSQDFRAGGVTNLAFEPETSTQTKEQDKHIKTEIPNVFKSTESKPSAMKDSNKSEGNKKKIKSVMFQQSLTTEYPAEPSDSAVELTGHRNINQRNEGNVKFTNTKDEDQIPSPRNAFLQRPDTPYQSKPKPGHSTPVKAVHLENDFTKTAAPDNASKEVMPAKPALPWIGQANPGNTRNSDAINDKIAKRQRKIGLLLKDLVLSSSTVPRGKPKFLENDTILDDSSEERPGAKNTMFATTNLKPGGNKGAASSEKVTHTPVKTWDPENDKVFPYTSDLMSFPSLSPSATTEDLERYGAQAKRKKKGKAKDTGDDDNMLFKPRHNLLNLDAFGPDRNCFSDQDVNDSDITDLETEPESAISDTEGITSSRLIPVVKTDRTVSVDALDNPPGGKSAVDLTATSDLDTDLEITDCEVEEEALARKLRAPRILPGAQAAHEMNASRSASAKSRDYIPPNSQPRRRGGSQNDSRRRYLALNSLRRKAYELKQNARTKAPSPKPTHKAQLLSYNTRKMPQVTIMSQV